MTTTSHSLQHSPLNYYSRVHLDSNIACSVSGVCRNTGPRRRLRTLRDCLPKPVVLRLSVANIHTTRKCSNAHAIDCTLACSSSKINLAFPFSVSRSIQPIHFTHTPFMMNLACMWTRLGSLSKLTESRDGCTSGDLSSLKPVGQNCKVRLLPVEVKVCRGGEIE